jgi:hypothetical protein
MSEGEVNTSEGKKSENILRRYIRFRSTIYGRVVYIITISSVILFVSMGIIFRSVYEQNLNTVIRQTSNAIWPSELAFFPGMTPWNYMLLSLSRDIGMPIPLRVSAYRMFKLLPPSIRTLRS